MSKLADLLICYFLLYIFQAGAQPVKQNEYVVRGTIKGIASGSIRMLSDDGVVLDSSVIEKGVFIMKGQIGLPERRVFNISPGNWSFKAFVEGSIIMLVIDTAGAQHFAHNNNKWALIWEIDETGSQLADVYKQYKEETGFRSYTSVLSRLNEKISSVEGNADQKAELEKQIDSIRTLAISQEKNWIEKYIAKHPKSVAGVYLFNELYQTSADIDLAYLQAILKQFSAPATASVYYKQLAVIATNLENIQPNSSAPDFTLLKRDKTYFSLSTTRGYYTIIDFWATWCIPCRRAIPHLKKIYAKYHPKGLVIVSISNDRNWNAWQVALKKEQMPWIQVIDKFPNKNQPGTVAELYGCKALPLYILLDKEGKIMLTTGNPDELVKKTEALLN